GVVDPTEVRLLEDALRALGNEDSALRSRVVLGLARALMYATGPDRSGALADEALAIARRVGEPGALATALWARHFRMMRAADLRERLAGLTGAIDLAERADAPKAAFDGRASLVHDLLESGDIVSAEREIDALARDPEHSRVPVRRWIVAVLQASLAISSGRGEEGARPSAHALQLRRDGPGPAGPLTPCRPIFL